MEQILIVVGVSFGVIMYALSNQFEKLKMRMDLKKILKTATLKFILMLDMFPWRRFPLKWRNLF